MEIIDKHYYRPRSPAAAATYAAAVSPQRSHVYLRRTVAVWIGRKRRRKTHFWKADFSIKSSNRIDDARRPQPGNTVRFAESVGCAHPLGAATYARRNVTDKNEAFRPLQHCCRRETALCTPGAQSLRRLHRPRRGHREGPILQTAPSTAAALLRAGAGQSRAGREGAVGPLRKLSQSPRWSFVDA